MTTTNSTEIKKNEEGSEISLEQGLLESLGEVRDALKSGTRLDKKYTVRTIELELEPHEYTPAEIKRIREMFNSSQAVFAQLIGVEKKTLQSWEQGQRPPKIARRMFDMMKNDPKAWLRMLKESEENNEKPQVA